MKGIKSYTFTRIIGENYRTPFLPAQLLSKSLPTMLKVLLPSLLIWTLPGRQSTLSLFWKRPKNKGWTIKYFYSFVFYTSHLFFCKRWGAVYLFHQFIIKLEFCLYIAWEIENFAYLHVLYNREVETSPTSISVCLFVGNARRRFCLHFTGKRVLSLR